MPIARACLPLLALASLASALACSSADAPLDRDAGDGDTRDGGTRDQRAGAGGAAGGAGAAGGGSASGGGGVRGGSGGAPPAAIDAGTQTIDLDPQAGNDDFQQPDCGPPLAAVEGPLCGPTAQPCRVLSTQTFDLLGEPAISIAFGQNGLHMLQAKTLPEYLAPATATFKSYTTQIRGPTKVAVASHPVPGSLALALGDQPFALLHGGGIGLTELWRDTPDGWVFDSKPDSDFARAGAFFASERCLHAALLRDRSTPTVSDRRNVYAVHDGAWHEFALGPTPVTPIGPASLAIDARGTPHLAYWALAGTPYTLYYAVPGHTLEVIPGTGNGVAFGVMQLPTPPLLALTQEPDGGDAVIHVVRAFVETDGNTKHIVLATRRAGTWTERDVLTVKARADEQGCQPVEGQTCTYTATRAEPLALFASAGGDLRVFISRSVGTETQTYQCTRLPADCVVPGCSPPPPMCGFQPAPPAADAKHELLIGWLEGDRVEFGTFPGPLPQAVGPDGHFWSRGTPASDGRLTLVESGP